eukprot:gene12746-14052_t
MLAARRRSDSTSDMNLADEVEFISRDVKFAVQYISVSSKIPESEGRIYMNIETKENNKFCVELSKAGFRVVGFEFDSLKQDDDDDISNSKTYETIYSLLSEISSSYCKRFSAELSRKLELLDDDNSNAVAEDK